MRGSEVAAASIGINPTAHRDRRVRAVGRDRGPRRRPAGLVHAPRDRARTSTAYFVPELGLAWIVLVVTLGLAHRRGRDQRGGRLRVLPGRRAADVDPVAGRPRAALVPPDLVAGRPPADPVRPRRARRTPSTPKASSSSRSGVPTSASRGSSIASSTGARRIPRRRRVRSAGSRAGGERIVSLLEAQSVIEELRGHHRAQRCEPRRRRRGAGRAHRSERCRQDHVLQLPARYACGPTAAGSRSTARISPACRPTAAPGSASPARSNASSCSSG